MVHQAVAERMVNQDLKGQVELLELKVKEEIEEKRVYRVKLDQRDLLAYPDQLDHEGNPDPAVNPVHREHLVCSSDLRQTIIF